MHACDTSAALFQRLLNRPLGQYVVALLQHRLHRTVALYRLFPKPLPPQLFFEAEQLINGPLIKIKFFSCFEDVYQCFDRNCSVCNTDAVRDETVRFEP